MSITKINLILNCIRRSFSLRALVLLFGSVSLSFASAIPLQAEEPHPEKPFNDMLETYVNLSSLVFTSTFQSDSSINRRQSSRYFVAAKKPSYLLIEETYTYPFRKISCVRKFICDGNFSYETNSLYPGQYIRRSLPSEGNLLQALARQFLQAPHSMTNGEPLALWLFQKDTPHNSEYWDYDWIEGSGKTSTLNGIALTACRYYQFDQDGKGQITYTDELLHLDKRNILYRFEHNAYFEQENIKHEDIYSQVETDPDIPPALFQFTEAEELKQVESFQ